MEIETHTQLAVLGHPQRLMVWRMLMRRYPDEMPAGEIAEATGLKASTLSVYLSALRKVGLVEQNRMGTSLRYRANVTSASTMLTYLFADCCRSRPELCFRPDLAQAASSSMVRKPPYNVLFICTANSARSIFAEALLSKLGGGIFNVYSAGTAPATSPNPTALEMLRAKGHDTSGLRSKSIEEFSGPDAPVMDFVFTVCDSAANEECPAWPGQPVSAHWGQPDPAKATGSDAERMLAFQQAYGALKNRITAFAALPFDQLNRASLQARVDEIALSHGTENA